MHTVSISRSGLFSVLRLAGCFGALALPVGWQPMARAENQPEPASEAPAPAESAVRLPVAGQIFLVMPTGESLRLGSVALEIFEKEPLATHLAARGEELIGRRAAMEKELARLRSRAAEADAARVRALEALEGGDAAHSSELAAFDRSLKMRAERLREAIRSNDEFIDSVEVLPRPPPGIPSPDEAAAYDRKRTQWLSMTRDERAAWAEVLANLNRDLVRELERLDERRVEKLEALASEKRRLESAARQAAEQAESAAAAVGEFQAELAAFPQPLAYLETLPPPVLKGRSDADGEFLFRLRPDRSYVLHASTERRFGNDVTAFTWLIEIDPELAQPKLLLSNHNLISRESLRALFETGELAGLPER